MKINEIHKSQVNEGPLGQLWAGAKGAFSSSPIKGAKAGYQGQAGVDKNKPLIDRVVKGWSQLAGQIRATGAEPTSDQFQQYLGKQLQDTSITVDPTMDITQPDGAYQAIEQAVHQYSVNKALGGQQQQAPQAAPTQAQTAPQAATAGDPMSQIKALMAKLTPAQKAELAKSLGAGTPATPEQTRQQKQGAAAQAAQDEMGQNGPAPEKPAAKPPFGYNSETGEAYTSAEERDAGEAANAKTQDQRAQQKAQARSQQAAGATPPPAPKAKKYDNSNATDAVVKTPNGAKPAAVPPQLGTTVPAAPAAAPAPVAPNFAQRATPAGGGYGPANYNGAPTANVPMAQPRTTAPAPAAPRISAPAPAPVLKAGKENKKPSIAEAKVMKKLKNKLIVKEMALAKAKRDKGII